MIGNFLKSVRHVDTRRELRELRDCGKKYVGRKGGGSLPHCYRECEVVITSCNF